MAIATLNDVRREWTAERVLRQVRRAEAAGVQAAAIFFASRVRELLSVPAPRKRMVSKLSGRVYYQATTPASPGAPPRKLSGDLRRSINWEMRGEAKARVGTWIIYGSVHELVNGHAFLIPAALYWLEAMKMIAGRAMTGQVTRGG